MKPGIKKKIKAVFTFVVVAAVGLSLLQCTPSDPDVIGLQQDASIVLIGNNLGSRMMYFGHFETEMHLRYPDHSLLIRNQSIPGDTPGFRPHSSRDNPWAFPGAEAFQTELATNSGSEGHFPSPDEWIAKFAPDVIIAFFGFNESFRGEEGLDNYKAELDAFIRHTLSQNYKQNSSSQQLANSPTQLVLVSPIAFEDLSDKYDLPDGTRENSNLELYTEAMREVAANHNVRFIDFFSISRLPGNSC
jgi:hypothetical protein